MATLLVVKLGALGDLLLADGALRDLRAHHAGERIVLLTRRPFAAMMARCPWVDEVIADDNAPRWRLDRMLSLARRLRGIGARRVVDLQNSRRSAFYRHWLLPRAQWCGGERASGRGARATPVLERHAAQLAACGVPVAHARAPRPDWLATPLPAALEERLRSPFAVLLPGSSARHPGKRWPHYAELARLLQLRGLQVFSAPGPDEMAALDAMPGEPLLDGGRPLTIPQLACLLPRAACVFGNDSGPTHLAAHLGCRGVAVFGPGPAPWQTGIVRERFAAIVGDPLAALDANRVLAALP
ncbi:MAG: lipopolysaccharide heptosyltransferase family protein [Lysobacteraceae bacterium]|nr:MAG: lipopolysaccharide heptosyltransferase family protein [Xanthomonadaceae bacterium]